MNQMHKHMQATDVWTDLLNTHWLTLWYNLAIPWCVQSLPRVGKIWPKVSDLNKEKNNVIEMEKKIKQNKKQHHQQQKLTVFK